MKYCDDPVDREREFVGKEGSREGSPNQVFRMAELYQELTPKTLYVDKKSGFSKPKWAEAIKVSRTLYVGNLSFYTSEEQIHELFSKCGEVKRVVMGLNRYKKSPCGFCFIEYSTHEQAAQAVNLLNKTMFDDRLIRVDWDAGISEGRQFGRGESGDQWRDDFRSDFDVARGGAGRNLLRKIEDQPNRQVYVGKLRNDHGRFGKEEAEEPAAKRPRQEVPAGYWGGPGLGGFDGFGSGLPMSFGPASRLGTRPAPCPTTCPTASPANRMAKGRGKGKGKGKNRMRDSDAPR